MRSAGDFQDWCDNNIDTLVDVVQDRLNELLESDGGVHAGNRRPKNVRVMTQVEIEYVDYEVTVEVAIDYESVDIEREDGLVTGFVLEDGAIQVTDIIDWVEI